MIDTGSYNKVSLQDAIFEAKHYLALQNSTVDDDFLELLAWRAVKSVNAISLTHLSTQDIPVKNGVAMLPKHLVRFIWFRVCGGMNVDSQFIYADKKFYHSDCGCDISSAGQNVRWADSVVSINGNRIEFNNVDFINFTHIQVFGIFYDTDADGMFLIPDELVQPVVYRICHEYAIVNIKKYDKYQIERWGRQSVASGNKARSDAFKRNFQNNIDQAQSMFRAYNYAPLVSRSGAR